VIAGGIAGVQQGREGEVHVREVIHRRLPPWANVA
jgi:hypothetical protein